MTKWLQRLRGALGMGALWSVILTVVGSVIIAWPGGVTGHPYMTFFVRFVAQFTLLGFLGGVTFSTVLSLVEGRSRFREMSIARFAAWGACGGFMMWGLSDAVGVAVSKLFFGPTPPPVLNWVGRTPGITYVLLGAVSAAMVLMLARLVGAAEEAESAGLGEDEFDEGEEPGLIAGVEEWRADVVRAGVRRGAQPFGR
ncbi:hypothetical protein V3331_02660 [Gaopeijia maritima]|uniref:hypothetical protein n=1 Tax=Gaopeijia maritima TaxID=3119007 RepID=UPI00324F0077